MLKRKNRKVYKYLKVSLRLRPNVSSHGRLSAQGSAHQGVSNAELQLHLATLQNRKQKNNSHTLIT
jgi:hypothetical protein